MSYREALAAAIRNVIAPAARQVGNGEYPRGAVRALGRAGLLGLTVSDRLGGLGKGLSDAVQVVETVARVCPSTGVVLCQHYAATAVLERHAPHSLRAEIAAGRHLSTLALADVGTGPDFWACAGSPRVHHGVVDLHSHKRWVVSAGEADSYLWSSAPIDAAAGSTLWLVAGSAPGLHVPADAPAIGLRGAGCADIVADPVHIPHSAGLGADGAGQEILAEVALPWYLALRSAVCLGLVQGALDRALAHVAHDPETPRPQQNQELGRIRLAADGLRIMLADAVGAAAWDGADTRTRLLALNAIANEAAVDSATLAMKACGATTSHRDCSLERRLRDALATRVLEPGTDAVLEVLGSEVRGTPAGAGVLAALATGGAS